jgi:hypothetical protein
MQAWAPTGADYCASIGKPLIDEEFGWQQGMGDGARAANFGETFSMLRSLRAAGMVFWNLGYEVGPGSYEVGPSTPQTFAVVRSQAP